jgi:hypothetical protein
VLAARGERTVQLQHVARAWLLFLSTLPEAPRNRTRDVARKHVANAIVASLSQGLVTKQSGDITLIDVAH